MDDLPALRHRILHYSHGVYYSDSLESNLPHEIEIEGHEYQRFMNYIFIPASTEDLSGEQILAVNELRKRLLRDDPAGIGNVNVRVRQVFLRTVEVKAPGSLLEVGPGFEPLFRTAPPGVQYWLADMSEEVLEASRSLGLACFLFTPPDSGVPLPQESVDLIIAIFVLQFSLTSEQLLELARILKPDGLMVANVYRRSEQSREMLLETFMAAGLQVIRVADRLNLCRGHEYWLIFKDPDSPALEKLQVVLEQS